MASLRLLLIGPFRRNRVGGVKTHAERLRAQALGLGFCVRTIDPRKMDVLLFPLWLAMSDVVHLHSSNGKLVRVMTFMARALKVRVIATVHANLADLSPGDRKGFLAASRMGAELLVLNDSSADFLTCHKVPFTKVTAFLPPSDAERLAKEADTIKLQETIRSLSADFDAIFITYVYDGGFQLNDTYGIDDLLGFFESHSRWALIVLCGCNARMLRAHKQLSNLIVFEGDVNVTDVAKFSHALLRNSRTDGDSLFVREGLYAGVTVVATDVVSRPAGVQLYPFGDHGSLAKVLRHVIAKPPVSSSAKPFDPLDLYCPAAAEGVLHDTESNTNSVRVQASCGRDGLTE